VLVALTFLDELWGGVLVIEAAGIESDHGFGHGAVSLLLLSLPGLVAAFIEAKLLLWAERRARAPLIAAAQLVVGLCALVAAWAESPWWLGAALAVSSPAGGIACGLGQVALVERAKNDEAKAMTAWTLGGALGDFAASAFVAIAGLLGYSWRAALSAAAALLVTHAMVVWRTPLPPPNEEADEDEAPTPTGPKPRALWIWLTAVASCALLDEIVVVLGGLHLQHNLGATAAQSAIALGVCAGGASVGLFATQRLLDRVAPRRLLAVSAVLCCAMCWAWLAAPTPLSATIALFLLGVTVAPLYPIASAEAYATLPDRPAVVAAIGHLFTPVDIALPFLLGVLADHAGLRIALAALALEPLMALAAVLLTRPGSDPP
jgi:predicted MFS family arabinose efflux permease